MSKFRVKRSSIWNGDETDKVNCIVCKRHSERFKSKQCSECKTREIMTAIKNCNQFSFTPQELSILRSVIGGRV